LSSDSASSPKASPYRDDTVHSQSSKEGNDLVGPTTADAPSNKISKPKGGAKKKKRKGETRFFSLLFVLVKWYWFVLVW
jgi:hypothetical protein